MHVSLLLTIFLSFMSTAIGAFVYWFFQRSRIKDLHNSSIQNFSPAEESQEKKSRVNALVESLFKLKSQLEMRVEQHSIDIHEIAGDLENLDGVGSAAILVAAKMLIDANQQLRLELDESKKEIDRQREMMQSCLQESVTDSLTGMPNRRAMDRELARNIADFRRYGATFSILILDLDHFKRINDRYGHMVGDQLLKSFSGSLMSAFRETDFVARFGGEEFVAILPKTSTDEACEAAERVRNLISAFRYQIGEFDLRVTISVGVKEFRNEETESEILEKADRALYAAKNGGRNSSFYQDGAKYLRYVPDVCLIESRMDKNDHSLDDTSIELSLPPTVDFRDFNDASICPAESENKLETAPK